jgi:hypothetical protein
MAWCPAGLDSQGRKMVPNPAKTKDHAFVSEAAMAGILRRNLFLTSRFAY